MLGLTLTTCLHPLPPGQMQCLFDKAGASTSTSFQFSLRRGVGYIDRFMRDGSHMCRSMCLASRMAPQSWKLATRCFGACLLFSPLGRAHGADFASGDARPSHCVARAGAIPRGGSLNSTRCSPPKQVSLTAGGAALGLESRVPIPIAAAQLKARKSRLWSVLPQATRKQQPWTMIPFQGMGVVGDGGLLCKAKIHVILQKRHNSS